MRVSFVGIDQGFLSWEDKRFSSLQKMPEWVAILLAEPGYQIWMKYAGLPTTRDIDGVLFYGASQIEELESGIAIQHKDVKFLLIDGKQKVSIDKLVGEMGAFVAGPNGVLMPRSFFREGESGIITLNQRTIGLGLQQSGHNNIYDTIFVEVCGEPKYDDQEQQFSDFVSVSSQAFLHEKVYGLTGKCFSRGTVSRETSLQKRMHTAYKNAFQLKVELS